MSTLHWIPRKIIVISVYNEATLKIHRTYTCVLDDKACKDRQDIQIRKLKTCWDETTAVDILSPSLSCIKEIFSLSFLKRKEKAIRKYLSGQNLDSVRAYTDSLWYLVPDDINRFSRDRQTIMIILSSWIVGIPFQSS